MKINISKNMKKQLFMLTAALILGSALSVCLTLAARAYSRSLMRAITSEVFRFHILAESNTEADQAVKLALRDKILNTYEPFLTASGSKAETAAFFKAHLNEIEALSKEFLAENGAPKAVKAEVTKSAFPLRRYGEVTLPAGTYDCLKITIGSGSGHNWWCVMFPPLCYTDATYDEVKAEPLSPKASALITAESPSAPKTVKIKFKILELFQKE